MVLTGKRVPEVGVFVFLSSPFILCSGSVALLRFLLLFLEFHQVHEFSSTTLFLSFEESFRGIKGKQRSDQSAEVQVQSVSFIFLSRLVNEFNPSL